MSTHGRSGNGGWIIGSITDKVIHTATSSMLVVHSSPEGDQTEGQAHLQRIILPLDGSELSEQAIPTARELATSLGLEVILFRAISTIQLSMAGAWPVGYPDVLEEVEDDARSYLTAKESELRSQGVDGVEAQVGRCNAAAEIVDLVRRYSGDLVVMTSRGRSGLGRAFLGSVADRVVCNSGAPVLLVRT